jgi:hypothetical protein
VGTPLALLAGYRAGVDDYHLSAGVDGRGVNAGNSLLSTSIIPENFSFQHYADLFNGQVNYLTWYWNFDENQLPDHGADLNQRQLYRLRLLALSL